MKYIGSAFKYVFKNFIFVFLFAIIPAYFLAMTADIENIASISESIFSGKADLTFAQLFAFLSPLNGKGWPWAIVFFVSAAVCMPMLFGFIEKHMRIGSRSLKGLAGRFNNNFLSTLVILLIFTAVFELWALIAAGLVFAVTLLIDGFAAFIVALIVLLGMDALIAYIASLILLWLPCLQITGYSFMDALSYSNQLYAQRKGRLFLAVFLPLLAGVVLQMVIVWVSPIAGFRIPVFILLELVFLILFLYYCVLMYVAYFDAAGEERMDLKKKF